MKTLTNAGLVKLTLCVSLAAALAACGGGGGGNTAVPSSTGGGSTPAQGTQLTGKAIDGYLSGATVCFDNGAGACDPTLATTTTDAAGSYSLPYSGNIIGKKLLVVVTPSTKDLSRSNYTFPASFALTGVVTDPTTQTNITPISTMIESMMESGMSQQAATQAVAKLLGEPANLSVDYIASGDPTATNFAMQIVNAIGTFASSGQASAATVRALMQAMVVNSTLTPTQAQVAAQAQTPVYVPANASQVLTSPTYSLDGYLYDWVNGPKNGTNQQAPVESVRQITNSVLSSVQQEFVNGAWSTPALNKYNQMIGAYELKGDASGFTPYVSLEQYNALPVSGLGPTLTGTDPNTSIPFTYEYRAVDLSNQSISTAVSPNGESLFPLWTSPTITSTNFAAGTKAYAGLLSYSTERVVIPVWQPICATPTVASGVTCGGAPAVMDGSQVVEVSSPTATKYTSVQQAVGLTLLAPGGGSYFQLLVNGTVQQVQPNAPGTPDTVVNADIGSWTTYSRNSNVIVVTFNATELAALQSAAASQQQAQVDPQTVPVLNGASTVVALVNNNLMVGWLFPTTYTDRSVQFSSALPQSLLDAVNAAAAAFWSSTGS
ncbi:hypothetical protein AWB69_00729 [Caballeronia udeis]|uniref:Lipoprotein n=1 Tax=Caballeronia udeis TaxID=1232866 RepID=A0A158F740_9BURK|nr:hypothetical protein [Caballeronia udeis]SAL15463.1 hypothetical protein AWB69_00729 [Caballeronia udeis]